MFILSVSLKRGDKIMLPKIKITPFKNFVLQNFPFIANDFDSLSEYGLICKIIDYLKNLTEGVKNTDYNILELYNSFVELKNYIDNYFANLDVQDELNNKINEMTENGELESIINKDIFNNLNEKINNSQFIVDKETIEKFKNDVRNNICSYLNVINPCDSRIGLPINNGVPVCGVYETAKGYLGLVGWGKFDTSDTRTINGIEHKVFKSECGTLASLIYKDIPYYNSPYYFAFNNLLNIDSNEMYMKALENQSQQKPYTIDMFEQWTARYVAYNQDKSGNNIKQVSIKTLNGVNTDFEVLNSLETGDMIFIGYSTQVQDGNFKGINHIGVYVKTIEELNQLSTDKNITYQAWNGHPDNGHGYIFEMMNSSSNDNDYTNCMRLTALDDYININLGGREWISVLTTKPYSNQLNDNKALKLAKNMELHYKHLTLFDMNPSWRNERANYNFTTGELKLRSLGVRGIQQQEVVDLNTIIDNCILTFMNKNLAQNLPDNFPNINFTLINIGGIDGAATKQIIICSGSNPKMYMRVLPNSFNNDSNSWGNWYEFLSTTPQYTLINENTSVNDLLNSGYYYAQSISNIQDLPEGVANTGFTIEVVKNSSGRFIKQIMFIHSKTNPRMFIRLSANVVSPSSDDWSDWKEVSFI